MTDPDPEVLRALDLDPEGRGPRRWWRWAAGASVVVATAAAIAWWAQPAPPASRFELERITTGTIHVTVSASGNVRPMHEVDVSSELSGIVSSVEVEENDQVSAGDVLARLDDSLLSAQLKQADAGVATARASLKQARIAEESARLERQRTDSLAATGGVSASQVDAARLNHESSVAGVQLAQANLASALAAQTVATTNVDKTVLRSPTDGVVLESNVDLGQAVVSALSAPVLFRVAEDLRKMSLVIDIDEADISKVRVGQLATFTVAAWPDHTFKAVVQRVGLAPEPGEVVVYEAELDVDNTEELLRPGMTATAELEAARLDNLVLVPSAALRFDPPKETPPAGPHIWVVDDAGMRAVPVQPGPSDGATTSVTGAEDYVGAWVAVGNKAKGSSGG